MGIVKRLGVFIGITAILLYFNIDKKLGRYLIICWIVVGIVIGIIELIGRKMKKPAPRKIQILVGIVASFCIWGLTELVEKILDYYGF